MFTLLCSIGGRPGFFLIGKSLDGLISGGGLIICVSGSLIFGLTNGKLTFVRRLSNFDFGVGGTSSHFGVTGFGGGAGVAIFFSSSISSSASIESSSEDDVSLN